MIYESILINLIKIYPKHNNMKANLVTDDIIVLLLGGWLNSQMDIHKNDQ